MCIKPIVNRSFFAIDLTRRASRSVFACLIVHLLTCYPANAAFITEDFGAKTNGLITDTETNMQWLRWDFIPVTFGFNPVTQEVEEVRPSPNTVIGFTEDPNSILFGFRLASQSEFEQLMINAGLHTIIPAAQSPSLSGQFIRAIASKPH